MAAEPQWGGHQQLFGNLRVFELAFALWVLKPPWGGRVGVTRQLVRSSGKRAAQYLRGTMRANPSTPFGVPS
jgi:hypothetical protein